jgi:cation diffusion facilitator family transporter
MRSGFLIAVSIAIDAVLFALNLDVAIQDHSHAVLSQAVYNIADLVGSVMLAWGLLSSLRPPDVSHPFGYGKERFFWAFAASLVTFSLAGVEVLLSGIQQAIAPQPLGPLGDGLLVVGITLIASVIGVGLVLRELERSRRSMQSFLESSQQGIKTIFYQDVVSAVGSGLAFVGLIFVYLTRQPILDGLTAAGVGVLMLITGFVLAAEARELLVGKALSLSDASRLVAIVERDPRVRRVRSFQSMMLGPDDALLALRLNFQDGLTTDEIERTIDEIGAKLRAEMPGLRHLVIEPES